MADQMGWQSYLFIKKESVFGTPVTPDIWIPYETCDLKPNIEMYKANNFTGVRQRRAPNQPVKNHIQGTLGGDLLARQISTVSLAETVVSLAFNQPAGLALDSWTMAKHEPNDPKIWSGVRCNSMTISGTAGGPVKYSADLIGILETSGAAPALSASTAHGKAMLMQDSLFEVDGSAVVLDSFTLSINNALQIYHGNSYWPTVLAAGDRVITLSFTIRKTATTYDVKRRALTSADQTFEIILKGDHEGSGSDTYTTCTIAIDKMTFLDAVDQMTREQLVTQTVTYDPVKPASSDNDVDLTWSTAA